MHKDYSERDKQIVDMIARECGLPIIAAYIKDRLDSAVNPEVIIEWLRRSADAIEKVINESN